MEEGEAFFKKIVKRRSVNANILLKLIRGGRLDKEDKFKYCLFWFVHCILLEWVLSKTVDIDTIKIVDNFGFFEKYPWGKESFSLTLDYLKKRIDFSRQKKTFETKGVSSFGYTKPFPCSVGEMVNQMKTRCPFPEFSDGIPQKRVHPYLIPTVREMKQHDMKKFKAFIDEPNYAFIDGLKACLEGVTVITSSEDGEDGDDDRDFGGNSVLKHVTRSAGTSVQVQSRHSEERAGRDDSGIKEALLEVAALEHAFINAGDMMIPEVAAVVEKENLDEGDDGSAGVEKEDHDEGRQDEDDKNEKNGCEEENNEGDGEKTEEKNAQEVEKEQHKEEGKSDALEKKGITEKDNENEFPNLDEFLNEVSQEIDKMTVETKNVESLDNY
ncbi:hypothetical protein FXO38_33078 [Capsicum annuum]|nr:hypothetical protein FXO38_33078 [Capsicum annuum]KAF3619709.1 hypothetical protein FXO37_33585 [Capsicum annuum]